MQNKILPFIIFLASLFFSTSVAYADGIPLYGTVRIEYTDYSGAKSYVGIPNAKFDHYLDTSRGWQREEAHCRMTTNAQGIGVACHGAYSLANNCSGKSHHMLEISSIDTSQLPAGGTWRTDVSKSVSQIYIGALSTADYTDKNKSDPYTYNYPDGCGNSSCWVKTGLAHSEMSFSINGIVPIIVALENNQGGSVNLTYTYVAPIPPPLIAGCFYDKTTNAQISQGPFPEISVVRGDGQSRTASTSNGCWKVENHIQTAEAYAVRIGTSVAPNSFNPPGTTWNNTAWDHYWQSIVQVGSSSFENQKAGDKDCGQNCNFAFEPTPPPPPTVPDCTNLTGPASLKVGETGTYSVTAGGSAPITSVGMTAYQGQCNNEKTIWNPEGKPTGPAPYNPRQGSAGTHNFDFTPTTYGKYTLYGRVWNSNIAECRSDCVDGPPRYLCANAQLCKKEVVVAPKPTGSYSVACTDTSTALSYTHVVSNIQNAGIGLFQHSEIFLSFSGSTANNLKIRAFLGDPTWVVGNWFGYRLHRFNSWTGTGSLSVKITGDTIINSKNGTCHTPQKPNCTISDLATWTETNLPAYKYTIGANLKMAGELNDDLPAIGSRQIELLPTSCAPAPATITIKGTIREGKGVKDGANAFCASDLSKPGVGLDGSIKLTTPPNTTTLSSSVKTYSYTVPAAPTGTTSTLQIIPGGLSGYTCSCGNNRLCSYTIPTDKDGTYDFYVTKYNEKSWWQISGGNVFSTNSFSSLIPAACLSPNCKPFLVTREQHPSNTPLSAGIPMAGVGSISAGTGGVSDRTGNPSATNLSSAATKEDSAYFASLIALDQIIPTPTAGAVVSRLNELTTLPVDSLKVARYSGTLTISPTEQWSVASGQKYLIFADTVVIQDGDALENLITVADGGIFMIVAKSSITIEPSVGHTDPTKSTPNLEGIYITDGSITIDADNDKNTQDKRFIGAGTFVGWGGVALKRQYLDDDDGALFNNFYPAEQFIFRPDFMQHFPESLKETRTIWQEVN
jgi:hypothetical protein